MLGGFGYAHPFTVENNSDAAIDGYSLPLVIDTQELIMADKLSADCSDLRFVEAEMGVELGHAVDAATCNTNATGVWVMIPSLPAMSSVDIIMQYNAPGAPSTSDPGAAFLFFDDFDDGALDPEWTLDVLGYEANHDVSHSEGLDDTVYTSPGYSVQFAGHASCISAPFNGVQPFAATDLNLPLGSYCVEAAAQGDVTDFDSTPRPGSRRASASTESSPGSTPTRPACSTMSACVPAPHPSLP
jgi:hypothetical protein